MEDYEFALQYCNEWGYTTEICWGQMWVVTTKSLFHLHFLQILQEIPKNYLLSPL